MTAEEARRRKASDEPPVEYEEISDYERAGYTTDEARDMLEAER